MDDEDIVLIANPTESVIDWSRFSKHKRKNNVVVYCLRFRSNQRGVVIALEVQKASFLIWQLVQRENFAQLISNFEDNSGEKVTHDLEKLFLFVDIDDAICVRGRLSEAANSDHFQHSMLLSPKHPAVVLMLRQMNEDNHHEGTEYERSLVQQRFWVVGARNALCGMKSKCIRCRKLAVQPVYAFMVDLLKRRVEANVHPLKNTGVDYIGPFEVTVLRRRVKHWCCLFECSHSSSQRNGYWTRRSCIHIAGHMIHG